MEMSFDGLRWAEPFNLNQLGVLTNVEPVAGVYVLGSRRARAWQWYYVAHTGNLQRRLMTHLSGSHASARVDERLRRQDTKVSFFPMDDLGARVGSARYLWEALQPECNQRAPSGVPRLIPLPPCLDDAAPR
jgi:hypothetical protein